jgi:hypothetical protein
MTRATKQEPPDWFDEALKATGEKYKRIDVSKQVCPFCGVNVHIATDNIREEKPTGRGTEYTLDLTPAIYVFCACAQALPQPTDNLDYWRKLANWYHKNVAKPGSAKHRGNMLNGCPTTELIRFRMG